MKEATITATFKMRNAWDATDTVETGLQSLGGVFKYLKEEGFTEKLKEVLSRFGLELQDWQVVDIREQGEVLK